MVDLRRGNPTASELRQAYRVMPTSEALRSARCYSVSRCRLRREGSRKSRKQQLYTCEIMFSRLRDVIRRRVNRNFSARRADVPTKAHAGQGCCVDADLRVLQALASILPSLGCCSPGSSSSVA